jgi:hypothetical protein
MPTFACLAILIAWLTEMLLPTIGAGKKIVLDTVYLSIKGYKKPPSFSRLRIIDSRQVGFNCIP